MYLFPQTNLEHVSAGMTEDKVDYANCMTVHAWSKEQPILWHLLHQTDLEHVALLISRKVFKTGSQKRTKNQQNRDGHSKQDKTTEGRKQQKKRNRWGQQGDTPRKTQQRKTELGVGQSQARWNNRQTTTGKDDMAKPSGTYILCM